jgi:hypothetical protein
MSSLLYSTLWTPLPSGAEFTRQDCSSSYVDVMKLQEELGFEYTAAIGSLIYLMNTFVRLTFAIRKLAKVMQAFKAPAETCSMSSVHRHQVL